MSEWKPTVRLLTFVVIADTPQDCLKKELAMSDDGAYGGKPAQVVDIKDLRGPFRPKATEKEQ